MQAGEVVRSLYDAYQRRELEKTASFVSDEFYWNVSISPGPAPLGGSCTGARAMIDRMQALDATFDYLAVKPQEFLVDGDSVAVRVIFTLRHKGGGDQFDIDCCHFWHTKDGKCTQVTEVYDTGIIEQHRPAAAAVV